MGCFDTFASRDGKIHAQLKCLHCSMLFYDAGDTVPVQEHGLPETCSICDWNGDQISDELQGQFVIVKRGKLLDVIDKFNKDLVEYPIFDKHGQLLKAKDD